MIRVLICGSRDWTDVQRIRAEMLGLSWPAVIIHGAARGADSIAWEVAQNYADRFQVEVYPANWKMHGKAAGHIRNQQMLDEGKPDLVLAFRLPGVSRGTDDMIRRARQAGLPVKVVMPTEQGTTAK